MFLKYKQTQPVCAQNNHAISRTCFQLELSITETALDVYSFYYSFYYCTMTIYTLATMFADDIKA